MQKIKKHLILFLTFIIFISCVPLSEMTFAVKDDYDEGRDFDVVLDKDKITEKLKGNIYNPDGTNNSKILHTKYDYMQYLQIVYGFAGLELDPKNGNGVDPVTKEPKVVPPVTAYDVLAVAPSGEAYAYSAFGFGAEDRYSQYAKGAEVEKIEINGAFFNDIILNAGSHATYRGKIFKQQPMAKMPIGSTIYLLDYSMPGYPTGKKIIGRDFQVTAYSEENLKLGRVGNAVPRNDHTHNVNSQSNVYTHKLSDEIDEGGLISTFVVPYDDQVVLDKDTGKPQDFKNRANINCSNYIVFSPKFLNKESGVQDWFFTMYVFEAVEDMTEEVVDSSEDYCIKHPTAPGCRKIIYDECETNPEKEGCKKNVEKISLPYCVEHPDDILCRCEENPDHPDCKPRELSYCERYPNDPKCKPIKVVEEEEDKEKISIVMEYNDDPVIPTGEKPDNKVDKPDDEKGKDKKRKKKAPPAPVIKVTYTPVDENTPDSNKKPDNIVKGAEPTRGKDKKRRSKAEIDVSGIEEDTIICLHADKEMYPDGKIPEGEDTKFGCFKYVVGNVDIGMAKDTRMSGNGVDDNRRTYKKDSIVKLEFKTQHYKGKKSVPNPVVDIVVKDDRNRVIYSNTQTVSGTLEPGEKLNLQPITFKPTGKYFTATAKINKQMAEKKLNIENDNDIISMSGYLERQRNKNYSVRDVICSPQAVTLDKNNKYNNQNLNIHFLVTNDSSSDDALPSTVNYQIYVDNQLKEQSTVNVAPGGSTVVNRKTTVNLGYCRNNTAEVKVVVNPYRNPAEKRIGFRNPYNDNVATTTIKGVQTVEGCLKRVNNPKVENNKIKTDIPYDISYTVEYEEEVRDERITETYYDFWGRKREYSYWTYRWDEATTNESITEIQKNVRLKEKMEAKPYFRSKLTYDKQNVERNNRGSTSSYGWIPVRGNNLPIKNGYGLELKVMYNYDLTTLNGRSLDEQMPNNVAKNHAYNDFRRLYIGVDGIRNAKFHYKGRKAAVSLNDLADSNTKFYVSVPPLTNDMKSKTCIEMTKTKDNKIPASRRTEFQLPRVKDIASTGYVHKLYTRKTNIGVAGPVEFSHPKVIGFTGDNVYLQQQVVRGNVEIKANDDVKTHIIQ